MVNTEIRLITFFAAKDGETLYGQQKQDWELTAAQIMNSLLPNQDLNSRKKGKALDHSVIKRHRLADRQHIAEVIVEKPAVRVIARRVIE